MSFWSSLTKGIKNIGSTVVRSFSSLDGAITGGLAGGSGYLGNLGDTITSGLSNAWDQYTGRDVAMKNYELQKDQYEKQNALNERQFSYQQQMDALTRKREDTAMQRKVADLKAAGLNPVLAANGSGASSASFSAPAQRVAPAPQIENTSGAIRDTVNQVFQMLSMKKDFAQKDAQIKLLQSERDKVDAEAAGIKTENEYKSAYLAARNENLQLENKLKSGTLDSDIEMASAKLSNEKKKGLIYNMELTLGQDKHVLNKIDIEIQKLVKEGKITENQILDNKLELLTTECLQKALDYSNAEWDTEWYHNRGLPNGFNAGWMGQLALLISGIGEKGARELYNFFSGLFGVPSGSKGSNVSYWKALDRSTFYPRSSNSTFDSIMHAKHDYGVRRNH